jgi:steroid delta-isomerase-like uncharacterized protein
MANAGELLDQVVQTFNEERWEENEALWNADGVQEEIGTGRTRNVAEAMAGAKDWKVAFPDVRGTIEQRLVDGQRVAGEIVWRGTHRGPLMGMPPTGKPIEVRAVLILTEEGGKIARMRHYLDIAGMMNQLGMAPGGPG